MVSTKILILGTSHISPQSIKKIKLIFKKQKPDLLCLELDHARFEALITRKVLTLRESIKVLGVKTGMIAWVLSYIQRTLGKKTGIMPGEEMIIAADQARDMRIPIAFIDRDARITIRKLAKIPLREKISLLFGFTDTKVAFDLKKIPSPRTVEKMISLLKKKTPNLYKVLIEERDIYMSEVIQHISQERKPKKILAVVGAGHRKSIAARLRKKGFKKVVVL